MAAQRHPSARASHTQRATQVRLENQSTTEAGVKQVAKFERLAVHFSLYGQEAVEYIQWVQEQGFENFNVAAKMIVAGHLGPRPDLSRLVAFRRDWEGRVREQMLVAARNAIMEVFSEFAADEAVVKEELARLNGEIA